MIEISVFDSPDGYSSSRNISQYFVRFLQSCISKNTWDRRPLKYRETKTKRKIVRGICIEPAISALSNHIVVLPSPEEILRSEKNKISRFLQKCSGKKNEINLHRRNHRQVSRFKGKRRQKTRHGMLWTQHRRAGRRAATTGRTTTGHRGPVRRRAAERRTDGGAGGAWRQTSWSRLV